MKQKKLNNKGFSLVELIIVIAIMAVLIGLLAPQFLKYVQRSKYSTDVKNGQEIATVIQTLIADNKLKENATDEAFSGSQKAFVEGVGEGKLLAEAPKSKVKDSNVFKVSYDVTNGKVIVNIVDGSSVSQVFPDVTGDYATMLKN